MRMHAIRAYLFPEAERDAGFRQEMGSSALSVQRSGWRSLWECKDTRAQ